MPGSGAWMHRFRACPSAAPDQLLGLKPAPAVSMDEATLAENAAWKALKVGLGSALKRSILRSATAFL